MSTDSHYTNQPSGEMPVHKDVTYEGRDINVGTVVKQLIYLGITIVVSLAICVPILNFLTGMATENDTPMPPVRAELSQPARDAMELPPEPRLQGVPGHENDAQQDLRNKIAADSAANESIGWVDKANGVAKIPVSEAMKIIAAKAGNGSAALAPEKKP
jgi:hypothetical protein